MFSSFPDLCASLTMVVKVVMLSKAPSSASVRCDYSHSETVHKNVVVRAVINNSGKNSLNVLACLAFERTRVGKSETSSNIAYRALARSASNSSNRSLCWISRVVHSFSHREFSQTSYQRDLDRAAAHAVYPRFLRLKSPMASLGTPGRMYEDATPVYRQGPLTRSVTSSGKTVSRMFFEFRGYLEVGLQRRGGDHRFWGLLSSDNPRVVGECALREENS
ncbi:hypothetical protein T01_5669 [Trichinella spiralis]|uniref:Uncharacterized protein n=1 Tax=Trichinella spiralis TaxID=6334 RepID=A0A0V1AU03_TRISP|nr:hypothetical protein T01_5669 [Trichinella spiralis]